MVVASLAIELVEVDGVWFASAPWLAEPVTGATSGEAFQRAFDAPRRGWKVAA